MAAKKTRKRVGRPAGTVPHAKRCVARTISLRNEQWTGLDRIDRRRRVGRSRLVQEAVDDWLRRQEGA